MLVNFKLKIKNWFNVRYKKLSINIHINPCDRMYPLNACVVNRKSGEGTIVKGYEGVTFISEILEWCIQNKSVCGRQIFILKQKLRKVIFGYGQQKH